jgi:dihydroorotate dehydrogenase
MSFLYEKCIRPLLFRQDPEVSHEQAIAMLKFLAAMPSVCRLMEGYNQVSGLKPIELFGLSFPNPVGLAAGFDKNAVCWPALKALGFGFAELGTVSYQRQPGNPRPRLERYPCHEALINRMGFNSDGAEAVARRLARTSRTKKRNIPLGVNIGKSKVVPLDCAAEDYLNSFHRLADFADYFTINVSSPNTPELRKLQGKRYLEDLLKVLKDAAEDRSRKMGVGRVPLLVKVSADLGFRQLDAVLEVVDSLEIDGLITTNTLLWRPSTFPEEPKGGLSGEPILGRALKAVSYIHRSTGGKLPIIGVGGIMNPEGAGRMMDAGASLIQIYTALVYRGPFFAKTLAKALSWRQRPWLS